jgi:hypothetical protein
MESLSLDPSHVRLERANSGAPVLDNHSRWGSTGQVQIGVIERAWIEQGQLMMSLRLSKRDGAKEFVQDIKDGIIRNVSVGYNVFTYEITEKEGELPHYRATDWEPAEISFVPVPFDYGAQVRSADNSGNTVELIYKNRNTNMENNETQSAEQNRAATPAPAAAAPAATAPAAAAPAAPAADNAAERNAGVQAERQRSAEITTLCQMAGLDRSFGDDLISRGVDIESARAQIQAKWAAKQSAAPAAAPSSVSLTGADEREQIRAAMEESLLHRVAPSAHKLESQRAKDFRGFRLLDYAREAIALNGESYRGMSESEVVERALTTTDFPILLGNVTRQFLRRAYETAPSTWKPIASRGDLSDFKPQNGVQFGGSLSLEKVNEHGEYKSGKLKEAKESIKLATYGKIIAITRQAIINDDMGGFTRLPQLLGRAAADLESDTIWSLITGNVTMGDGKALFHADHKNLAAAGAALSEDSLAAARLAIRKQTGLDAKEKLNLQPVYLIVPPELELTAQKLITAITANNTQDVNVFAGAYKLIVENRLSDASATAWYLTAAPEQIDMLGYGYLSGQSGLYTETRAGWNVDGVEVKARLDFGATAWDYRGFYKNPGA